MPMQPRSTSLPLDAPESSEPMSAALPQPQPQPPRRPHQHVHAGEQGPQPHDLQPPLLQELLLERWPGAHLQDLDFVMDLPAWGSLPPGWLPQQLPPLHSGAVPPSATPVPTPVGPASVAQLCAQAYTLQGASTSTSACASASYSNSNSSSSSSSSSSRPAAVVEHQSPSVNTCIGTRTGGAGAGWGGRDYAVGHAAAGDPSHAWAASPPPSPTELALLGNTAVGSSEVEGAGAVPPANGSRAEGRAAGGAGGGGGRPCGGVQPFPLELMPVLPGVGSLARQLRPPPPWD